jgi:hypothetical protein
VQYKTSARADVLNFGKYAFAFPSKQAIPSLSTDRRYIPTPIVSVLNKSAYILPFPHHSTPTMSSDTVSNGEATSDYQLYHYVPSLPAAVVAIVVFAILTIAHCHRLIKRRAWFCIAFAVGGLCECSLI